MNTKLIVLLVLISLPPLTFSAPFKFGGLIRPLKKLGKYLDKANTLCDIFENFLNGNCSISALTSANTDDTRVDISFGNYIMNFLIGSTQQNVSLIVDTTLDYTFMLCQPCQNDCATESVSYVYDRTLSSSYSNYTSSEVPYNYTSPYATSEGFLATDTFYFSNSSEDLIFGCGVQNTGYYGQASGYLGLGRGNLSLISQMGFQNFSYCLGVSNAIFLFGYDTSAGNSTPLVQNPRLPLLYYVSLTGITIGNQDLDIPSTAILPQPDGTGGMIIASTITLTLLEESAYNATIAEFKKQVNLSPTDGSNYGLDLCFDISGVDNPLDSIPQLILHFDGADMEPSIDNYFVSDTDSKILCLAVLPSTGISVMGTWMQTDIQMFYDLENNMLQFESADCSTLG